MSRAACLVALLVGLGGCGPEIVIPPRQSFDAGAPPQLAPMPDSGEASPSEELEACRALCPPGSRVTLGSRGECVCYR